MSEMECKREEVGRAEVRVQKFETRTPSGTRALPVNARAFISAFFPFTSALPFSIALERHSLYLAPDELC
jgi:hypothetical protein